MPQAGVIRSICRARDIVWVEPQERERRTPGSQVPIQQAGCSECGGIFGYPAVSGKWAETLHPLFGLKKYKLEEENQVQLSAGFRCCEHREAFSRMGLKCLGETVGSLRRDPEPGSLGSPSATPNSRKHRAQQTEGALWSACGMSEPCSPSDRVHLARYSPRDMKGYLLGPGCHTYRESAVLPSLDTHRT